MPPNQNPWFPRSGQPPAEALETCISNNSQSESMVTGVGVRALANPWISVWPSPRICSRPNLSVGPGRGPAHWPATPQMMACIRNPGLCPRTGSGCWSETGPGGLQSAGRGMLPGVRRTPNCNPETCIFQCFPIKIHGSRGLATSRLKPWDQTFSNASNSKSMVPGVRPAPG